METKNNTLLLATQVIAKKEMEDLLNYGLLVLAH